MNHSSNQIERVTVSHPHLCPGTLSLWSELSEEEASVISGGEYPWERYSPLAGHWKMTANGSVWVYGNIYEAM